MSDTDRSASDPAEGARLRGILARLNVGVFQVDPDGRILQANPAFAHLFGLPSLRPGVEYHLRDFCHHAEVIDEGLRRTLALGEPQSLEVELHNASGKSFFGSLSLSLGHPSVGLSVVEGLLEDITLRKEAERAARQTRIRQSHLFSALPIVLYTLRSPSELVYTWVSENFERVTGIPRSRLQVGPDTWWERIHPDDRDRVKEEYAGLESGGSLTTEYRWRGVDGGDMWFLDHAMVVPDPMGHSQEVLGSRMDVSTRKRVEEGMIELAGALENAAEGIARLAPNGAFQVLNRAYADILGYEAHELNGTPWLETLHPDDRERATKALEQAQERKVELEVRALRKDGASCHLEVVLVGGRVRDVGGATGTFCFAKDISGRRKAETEIIEKSRHLQAISTSMSGFLSSGSWERAGSILVREALRMTGSEYGFLGIFEEGGTVRISSLTGTGWDMTQGGLDETAVRSYLRQDHLQVPRTETPFRELLATGSAVLVNDLTHREMPTGRTSVLPAFRTCLAVPMTRGTEVIGTIAVANRPGGYGEAQAAELSVLTSVGSVLYESFRRTQQEATLSEQLRQSQKMEAIGRLAGGVAHDFNNLLTVINGYGELLTGAIAPEDPRRAQVDLICRAGRQASDLTRQLLAFSRKQVMHVAPVDVNAVMQRMTSMIRRLIGEDIELGTLPRASPSIVQADAGQIEQVLLNLVVNARDAMPKGGKLTIETATVEHLPHSVSGGDERACCPHVMLAVTDTGCGMDEETRSRVFEPFFTTKAQGTGLGLSMVYGIVRQSGGHVSVYSEPSRGSTFKVYLPTVECGAVREESPTPAPSLPRGRETVLLVEDDLLVRTLAREILAMSGYDTVEAPSGEEAMIAYEGAKGAIDLVLTDVVMTGIGGAELAGRLRVLRPGLPILFMSGYPDGAITQQGALPPGSEYLPKPFTPETLLRKLREILDKPR